MNHSKNESNRFSSFEDLNKQKNLITTPLDASRATKVKRRWKVDPPFLIPGLINCKSKKY